MKKSLNAALGAFAGLCLMAAAIGGCAQAGQQRAPGPAGVGQNYQTTGFGANNMLGVRNGDNVGNMTGVNPGTNLRTTPGLNTGVTGRQTTVADTRKASDIKRQVLGLNGVVEADVIVMGDTCLVGVNTDENAGTADNIRDNVARKVKRVDNTIKNVVVSTSPDILARMRRLLSDAAGGRTTNFADEFNRLVNRVRNVVRG